MSLDGDQVNISANSMFKDFPEEAIPLVIFNEQKRGKWLSQIW
jgi:hypothetical protein